MHVIFQRQKSTGLFKYSLHHLNWKYLGWFLGCEILGVVIAIANLFITNLFLGGKFFYYGEDALKYLTSSVTDPNNPLNQVFPKVCFWLELQYIRIWCPGSQKLSAPVTVYAFTVLFLREVGKCTWYTFGPTGTIQDKDALCVLPLNIVNEKVYVWLWLTYIILVAVTSAALIGHMVLFVRWDQETLRSMQ